MEIRNLITFLRATEEKSFSRTAAYLGYAQSTVTMQIKQLEEELGVRLFDRIGKTVLITEKGEELKKIAAVIVNAAAEASHIGETDTDIREPLRIGLTESLQNHYMPDLIHEYHMQNPKSSLIVQTATVSELIDRLAHNKVDFIFVCSERVRAPYLIPAWEKREPIYFVASPEHSLASVRYLTLKDILCADFLQTESDSGYGLALERHMSEKGYSLSSCLSIGNPDVILQLIRKNDGIAFLPAYICHDAFHDGTLSILDYDTSSIGIWTQLLYHKNKFITGAMRSFMNLTISRLTGVSAEYEKDLPFLPKEENPPEKVSLS
ncbi:MAG TPA: LysR family transcriptional regulator [Veillonellaceae bacterium]|jgi:DNA-binding transcriptional LysR family regulator|nr:LysR family transcriptional regulator [Veillonellaceae bacterium]